MCYVEFIHEHWFAIATFLLQSGLLGSVWAYFRRSKARDKAILSLCRTDIINLCYKAKSDGYIAYYNVENLDKLFRAYKALGGNGAAEELTKQTKLLPIKKRGD